MISLSDQGISLPKKSSWEIFLETSGCYRWPYKIVRLGYINILKKSPKLHLCNNSKINLYVDSFEFSKPQAGIYLTPLNILICWQNVRINIFCQTQFMMRGWPFLWKKYIFAIPFSGIGILDILVRKNGNIIKSLIIEIFYLYCDQISECFLLLLKFYWSSNINFVFTNEKCKFFKSLFPGLELLGILVPKKWEYF